MNTITYGHKVAGVGIKRIPPYTITSLSSFVLFLRFLPVTKLNFMWLFFQNAIQLQPHGGKNHIVLYQEMWLQSRLHVSKLLSAATSQRFNW